MAYAPDTAHGENGSVVVGVDIGGSGVRAGVVDPDGTLRTAVRRTLPDREVSTVVDAVCAAVESFGPTRIGIGVPGFVDGTRVIASPNFPAWTDVAFAELIGQRLGVPAIIENDANVAALGAWRQRGADRDLVLLTLGTGVGGGIVTGGRLLRGAGRTGAEVGHVFAGGSARCGCGGIGCLEQWCSTVGLMRLAAQVGVVVEEGRQVVRAGEHGEAWALDVLRQAGEGLGRGLVTLVNLFNPDEIVLAGGLVGARPFLEPPAADWLARYGIAPNVARVRVIWAGRAEDFAIVGAAEIARRVEA